MLEPLRKTNLKNPINVLKPASMAPLATGLIGAGMIRRRKQHAASANPFIGTAVAYPEAGLSGRSRSDVCSGERPRPGRRMRQNVG